jgi:histidyl-tRNA synthetase
MSKIAAPRGTADLYPPESGRWLELEARMRELARRFGYGEIRTPMFESTELFVRGVGETTDIVEKEMYTFTDKGGRSLTLRPEWTAPVVRAMLEHNLLVPGPLRLSYIGPFFRYERPQAGRYRQANQFGVECFGFAGPEADVEVMQIAYNLLASYGLRGVTLNVNTIGDACCRPAYREALLAHFRPVVASLSEDSQRRLERNPLRILDSKAPEDRPFVESAPTFLDELCDACRAHFAGVRELLESVGIPYRVEPRLVRGFDYYTRTVFEFIADSIGAQSTVCGGGRYDGLVKSLGGPDTPAVGFGLGLERFSMVLESVGALPKAEPAGLAAIALGADARRYLYPIVARLRARGDLASSRGADVRGEGLVVRSDYRDRKIAKQFQDAEAAGIRAALIAGDDEARAGTVTFRDLIARSERVLGPFGDAATAADAIADAYFELPPATDAAAVPA